MSGGHVFGALVVWAATIPIWIIDEAIGGWSLLTALSAVMLFLAVLLLTSGIVGMYRGIE